MTNAVRVEFDTTKATDVPRVGTRKTVRVNGRPETLYVRSVEVRAWKDYDDRGRKIMTYAGVAVMTTHDDLWR